MEAYRRVVDVSVAKLPIELEEFEVGEDRQALNDLRVATIALELRLIQQHGATVDCIEPKVKHGVSNICGEAARVSQTVPKGVSTCELEAALVGEYRACGRVLAAH